MHKALALIRLRRQGPRTRGQSLVEFALILPVFLLFFGAVLDLGRVAAAQVTVTNAAREGAFQAMQTPTSFDSTQPCPADGSSNLVVCRVLLEAKNSQISIAPGDVSLSCSPTCAEGLGNQVTVSVAGHFRLLTPILAAFFGGNQDLTFSAASTMQVETLPPPPSPVVLTSAPPTASPSATPTPTPTSPACQLPSAGFTYEFVNNPAQKAPLTVNFTDTSTSESCGITSWFWKFGDTGVSSDEDPSHTYTLHGTYFVTLTVTNAAGANTTGKVQIKVFP